MAVFTGVTMLEFLTAASALVLIVPVALVMLLSKKLTSNAMPRQIPICLAAFTIPEPMPLFSWGRCLIEDIIA
jgi:hypothetical protein